MRHCRSWEFQVAAMLKHLLRLSEQLFLQERFRCLRVCLKAVWQKRIKNLEEERNSMTGIIGYGTYIPKYRIKLEEIALMWQKNPTEIVSGLKVSEKAV